MTFRLGGERSILLSYQGNTKHRVSESSFAGPRIKLSEGISGVPVDPIIHATFFPCPARPTDDSQRISFSLTKE